ncbi:Thiamine biosynthesis lipoprotein ApbE precursor [Symmachiella dynata]|uniref:FAD:protein FMN transferase n=1 Tax=Symmachiella dynata TaxID=2527995 RepID=UPI00118AB677|nr:FAD:protein FMN transferase [Symmachiella dynata]QDT46729.1 Thiamine biosynthesis lipoprotein ApbE precursor [Symmachiella dynata]
MANQHLPKQRLVSWLLSWAAIFAIGGCEAPAVESLSLTGETMGTTYSITIADPPPDFDTEVVQTSLDAALETVNNQMSTWRPDSELSRFNAAQTTEWVPVSPELAKVVAAAQQISEQTDGAFDVTVGPLVQLWGFDSNGRPDKIPTQEQIDAARVRCGYTQLEVRSSPPALRKTRADVSVNLSAIAKGYGVDCMARLLRDAGVARFLVEIGGEVRTRGKNASGRDWNIAIEAPQAGLLHEVYRVVAPGERGMATSGDYRNFYEQDGKVYSHTIDPQTGRPIESTLASATVLADDCMTADAWATAVMVLGSERGMELAGQHNLPAMLILRAENNQFRQVANAKIEALFRDPAAAPAGTSPLTLFLIALTAFGLALIGMSIGVMISGRRIKGSCGGLNNAMDEGGRSICDVCTTPPEECDRVRAAVAEGADQHGGTE